MKHILVLLAIATIAHINAECPNACSGHGDCEAFDQCNCNRGWMSADSSDKQCDMGYAFTTTPQGDLNMDGDREDNSYKQLSEPGVIRINTNTITFARSGLQKNELKVGDGIRVCNENFIVTQLRGRTIATNDDYKDLAATTGVDDSTHEITSSTADDYTRRIKEIVLNTRHTQNCGTSHDGISAGTAQITGQIAKGDGSSDPTFTKNAGSDFTTGTVKVGSRVYVWCTGTDAGLFLSTDGASATGVNNYGYLTDGVYKDGGRFLTIKAISSTSVITFEERIGHVAGAAGGGNTCNLVPANDHIVYRHLVTQARPNGDWEKWKGDFKGTNTRPGRGPTMNNIEAATYQRLGVNFADGDAVGLGDYGQDEGHFYMECSNQGLCDRKTGFCECFDGYTGRACQRQSCPEDCSGHGVCLSVDQLRTADMTKLPMTCETKRDNKVVTCDGDVVTTGKLRAGDYVKIGTFPPMKINTIGTTGGAILTVRTAATPTSGGTARTIKVAEGATTGAAVAGDTVIKTALNQLVGTIATVALSGGNDDTITLVADAAFALAIGDQITIGDNRRTGRPQDNYNTTHFLSGLTPTNNKADKVDTFTLYNGFPESATYGTEIWQVHSYDLWDSSKNMACQCDPRWTGYDCSERKCPLGDDPLTVDTTDGQGTTTTTDDSAYTQSPEKQTLIMNSGQTDIDGTASAPTGMLIGHFTLAFEDYFGETFTTRPIPLEVEMSVSVSVAAAGLVVLFDGAEGLPVSELSRGDEIRIGQDIRFVETITYVDHNTKTHIKSFSVRDAYLGAGSNGENFHSAHATGSRLYRRDVSKEIREALLSVPNARIEGVSVEKLEISGDAVVGASATAGVLTAKYGQVASIDQIGQVDDASSNIELYWKAGDLIRVRSMVRIVTSAPTDAVNFYGSMGADTDEFQVPYRAAMQKYRIKFESGCMTDDHCNHNGVNSYDSDAGATCSLGGSCTCSLPQTTEQYHGFGCTRKGKGNDFHGTPRAINHARPYKRSNSGDLPLMMCDKDELFSGKILDSYVSVSKATPTKVQFNYAAIGSDASATVSATGATSQAVIAVNAEPVTNVLAGMTAVRVSDGALIGRVKSTATNAVTLIANLAVALAANDEIAFGVPLTEDIAIGDEIYIDGQVRTIVEKSNGNWVKVDLPFTIYEKSNDDDIVPSGSTAYKIGRLGGVGLSCQLTDMPRLTSHDEPNVAAKGTLSNENADGTTTTVDGDDTKSTQTNPHTKITIRPMDPQEVEIGDRIRVDTDDGSTALTYGTYITHTVDKINYEIATVDSSAAALTVPGGIASFTLNELVSVEATTTGNMVRVADSQTRFIYNDQRGTTENKECSGRGLCDETTGTCSCFKGYTDDDCSRQNSLASA